MAKKKKHANNGIKQRRPQGPAETPPQQPAKPRRPAWLPYVLAGAAGAALLVWSLLPSGPVPGQGVDRGDYLQFAELVTEQPEVTIYFSYACPHCYNTHDLLTRATDSLPRAARVHWVQVPFYPRDRATADAMVVAAAIGEQLGQGHALNSALFRAYHVDDALHSAADVETRVNQWLTEQGEANDFASLAQSPDVRQRIEAMQQRAEVAPIRGVPAVMVNGQYQLKLERFGSEQALEEIISRLVRR